MNQRLGAAPFVWLVAGASTTFIVLGLAIVVYVAAGGRVGRASSDLLTLGSAGIGIACALLGAFILAVATRQLVLGLPRALITSSGIALGRHLIRWEEMEVAGEVRFLGLSFVGVVVHPKTVTRLPVLDRLSADRIKGNLTMITLSEAQLRSSIRSANERIRALRPRAGAANESPSDIRQR